MQKITPLHTWTDDQLREECSRETGREPSPAQMALFTAVRNLCKAAYEQGHANGYSQAQHEERAKRRA